MRPPLHSGHPLCLRQRGPTKEVHWCEELDWCDEGCFAKIEAMREEKRRDPTNNTQIHYKLVHFKSSLIINDRCYGSLFVIGDVGRNRME